MMKNFVKFVLIFILFVHVKCVDVKKDSGIETVVHKRQNSQSKTFENVGVNPADRAEDTPAVSVKNITSNATVNTNLNKNEKNVSHIIQSTTGAPVNFNQTKGPIHLREHNGALLRSFYVFLGMSGLVVIYISFRTCRLRSGAPPPTIVRKYGVVGRRSDMEMLPLPLNEEEDDDTLFEVGELPLPTTAVQR